MKVFEHKKKDARNCQRSSRQMKSFISYDLCV